jgi:hypothetical protein
VALPRAPLTRPSCVHRLAARFKVGIRRCATDLPVPLASIAVSSSGNSSPQGAGPLFVGGLMNMPPIRSDPPSARVQEAAGRSQMDDNHGRKLAETERLSSSIAAAKLVRPALPNL